MPRGTAVQAALERDRPLKLSPEMASLRLLVLAFVRGYIERWDGSPSHGEIAAGVGAGRSSVRKALKNLAADGLILLAKGSRGIELPPERERVVRQLRALGCLIDEDLLFSRAKGTLPVPPLLDYVPGEQQGSIDGKHGGQARGARTAARDRRAIHQHPPGLGAAAP